MFFHHKVETGIFLMCFISHDICKAFYSSLVRELNILFFRNLKLMLASTHRLMNFELRRDRVEGQGLLVSP